MAYWTAPGASRSRASFLAGVVSALAIACSSGNSAAPSFVPEVPPLAAAGFDLTVAPFAVPAGTEVQNCHYFKAPTDVDVDIGKVLIDFSKGTHHMHLYWGNEDHADGVEDCFQAVDFDKWHLLVGAQKEHLEWTLPEGVAFKLKAHQQLLIQVHFVNAGLLKTDGDNAHGAIRLETLPPGAAKQYMGSIFGQQRKISLAPKSQSRVDGVCRIPHDIHMAALAGHYHFRGHDFIGYRMAKDGADGPEFYRTLSFGEPKFEIYTKEMPLQFAKDDRILWRCNYENESEATIPFGPREIDQEHCNMFAFYYPALSPQEFLPCVSYGRCEKECANGATCSATGDCVPATSCAPKCGGHTCGDDGCGGSCGACAASEACTSGRCVPPSCVPHCAGKACGDDGCGGSCGTCALGQLCASDACVAATCDTNGGTEQEPNSSASAANALCATGVIQGAITPSSDTDWFTWTVLPGAMHYDVTLSNLQSDLTFDVYRLASTGSGAVSKLGSAVDPGQGSLAPRAYSAGSRLGGTFYARVYAPAGAPGSPYSLRVAMGP